jgi:hypothetical protein
VAKDNNKKGKQSEADRLSAIARAYRKDADGKDISKIGGAVTDIGQSPAANTACYVKRRLSVLRLKRRLLKHKKNGS